VAEARRARPGRAGWLVDRAAGARDPFGLGRAGEDGGGGRRAGGAAAVDRGWWMRWRGWAAVGEEGGPGGGVGGGDGR
jgi:hypothetical protein